jgi:RimJ/RimL family protein N-acetyltransferase
MGKGQRMQRPRVYLRALEMDDLPRIYKWHNDPELYETLVGSHGHVSRRSVEQWLHAKTAFSKDEIAWAICLAPGDEHIGNIYLKDIDWIARHGHLAIFIGEAAHRSKGYGQAAIRLMLKHTFEHLGLLRVHLAVLSDNERAIRAYEKCGFQVEGCLHIRMDGSTTCSLWAFVWARKDLRVSTGATPKRRHMLDGCL